MKDAMYQGKRYRVLDEGKDFLVLQSGVGTPLAVKRADVTEAPAEQWLPIGVAVAGDMNGPEEIRSRLDEGVVARIEPGYRGILVDLGGSLAVKFEKKVSG